MVIPVSVVSLVIRMAPAETNGQGMDSVTVIQAILPTAVACDVTSDGILTLPQWNVNVHLNTLVRFVYPVRFVHPMVDATLASMEMEVVSAMKVGLIRIIVSDV